MNPEILLKNPVFDNSFLSTTPNEIKEKTLHRWKQIAHKYKKNIANFNKNLYDVYIICSANDTQKVLTETPLHENDNNCLRYDFYPKEFFYCIATEIVDEMTGNTLKIVYARDWYVKKLQNLQNWIKKMAEYMNDNYSKK